MPTIDELGRRAGAAARAAAAEQVDVEAGLRVLRADHAGHVPRRRLPFLVTAAAAVMLVVGLAVVAVSRPSGTRPVDSSPDTVPPSVSTATTEVSTTTPSTTQPSDGAPVDPTLLSVDLPARTVPLALPACDATGCPGVAATADGRLVALAGGELLVDVEGAEPRRIRLAAALASAEPWLAAVGPDDVAYLAVRSGPESVDLVAVPLDGAQAGAAVARVEGAVDISGDTDLVPSARGLVAVGCCGGSAVRPAPDARLVMGWVDRDGHPVTDDAPRVAVELTVRSLAPRPDAAGDWGVFTEDGLWLRGMPLTAWTGADALVAWYDLDGRWRLVRFQPDGTVQRIAVPDGLQVVLVDRWGAVVTDGASLLRWQLPAYAAAVDATERVVALAGTDRFDDLDALGRALVAALTMPDGCGSAPSAGYAVAPVSVAVVPVVVEYRTGCDDAVAGGRLEVGATLTGGQWVVLSASERALCSRGADATLCV